MDYTKYITAASEKSNKIDNLLNSLQKDENDLSNKDLALLRTKGKGSIQNLINAVNFDEAPDESGEINVNAPIDKTSKKTQISNNQALKNFNVENDIKLSLDLSKKIKEGGNTSEIFESKLLELTKGDSDGVELVKEETVNGETIKTFKNSEGKHITITSKNINGNIHSTLTNEDGSTIRLRYDNGGADGVAIERRSKGYESGEKADFTFVNANVVQQGTSSLEDVGNGEKAWVNEYSQIGIKDKSKIDNVVATFYKNGTSFTEWEKDGIDYLRFGADDGRVSETYNSKDNFKKANISAVVLDNNDKFKGYEDGNNLDLENDFYGNYQDRISDRRREILKMYREPLHQTPHLPWQPTI